MCKVRRSRGIVFFRPRSSAWKPVGSVAIFKKLDLVGINVMKLWYMRPCKPSDNVSLFRDWQPFCIDGSQELDYLVAIFKLTATANAGTFAGAPISENVHNASKYMYTKFGAFIKK